MAAGKPVLCVDFDGVIHSYSSGWQGEHVVSDPPVRGAMQWLRMAQEYFDVQIYSSRSKTLAGLNAMKKALLDWGSAVWNENEARRVMSQLSFPVSKPPAFLTVDDRAVCFNGDFESPALNPVALLNFKPWNQRTS